MNANQKIIEEFLKRNGVTNPQKVAEITSGFDLDKPVYEHAFQPGDRIFQFVRNEEVGRPLTQTGNWFCLPGATMESLAIFGGGAGRRLQEFMVILPVWGLEGIAAPMARNWAWAGGGRGG